MGWSDSNWRVTQACCLMLFVSMAAGTTRASEFITSRSLAFMTARGGISLGEPVHLRNGWQLPVDCDVSGIHGMGGQSRVLHAGLAWWRNVIEVDEDVILLTIETARQSPSAPSPRCGTAALGHLDNGLYQLYYLDPDGSRSPLGEVRLGDMRESCSTDRTKPYAFPEPGMVEADPNYPTRKTLST